MLKFIKKLFAKGEAKEEGIGIGKLNEWLDEKTRPIFDDLNNSINGIINRVNSEKEAGFNSLSALKNAELQNPKIPEMAKIIMEGNRAAFIRKVSFFFDSIDMEYKDYNELVKKCESIENQIDSLGKSTVKSYHVLNEFFAREAEHAAASIKAIENCCREIKNAVNGSIISKIAEIKNNIDGAQKKIEFKENCSIDLKNKKNSLEGSKNKKSEIEGKIKEIISGKGYKRYEKLLEEKSDVESEIKNIDNILFHDFSVLERALKKYAKISFEDENLIESYLSNPINALIEDASLGIVKVINNLERAVSENKFGLEQKKSDKTIAKIRELGKNYFEDLQNNHKKFEEKLSILRQLIENDSSKANLEMLENELSDVDKHIEYAQGKIANLSSEIEKINIAQLKESLQKEISSAINITPVIL